MSERTDIWTHWVSRTMQFLAETPLPRAIRKPVLETFGNAYGVNWDELPQPIDTFATFEDFFTRGLPDNARPICDQPSAVVSPCDGAVHSIQPINSNTLIQAKGKNYSVKDFLGPYGEHASDLEGGTALTLYLRPKDYHHVHSPFACELEAGCVVPGSLWPVNPWANNNVENLYARNERVGMRLKSQTEKPFTAWYFMVGALCVGGIETRFCYRPRKSWHGDLGRPIAVAPGDELGQFLFGSTVIMLLPSSANFDPCVAQGDEIQLGQKLGELHNESSQK